MAEIVFVFFSVRAQNLLFDNLTKKILYHDLIDVLLVDIDFQLYNPLNAFQRQEDI